MQGAPLLFWIGAGAGLGLLLFLGWRRLRHGHERELHAHRLWRVPALLTILILPLLFLQPHRPFRIADYAIFATAMLMGLATGLIRAHATRLRYDEESERLMAGLSLSALALLLPIGILRHVSRTYLGIGPEAASHGDGRAIIGSLLFVLAMLLAHRGWLFRRARQVLAARPVSGDGPVTGEAPEPADTLLADAGDEAEAPAAPR